jgi:serine/threonine protein phosphatase PrpC
LMQLLGHHPNDYLVTDDRINFTKRAVEEAFEEDVEFLIMGCDGIWDVFRSQNLHAGSFKSTMARPLAAKN